VVAAEEAVEVAGRGDRQRAARQRGGHGYLRRRIFPRIHVGPTPRSAQPKRTNRYGAP
jgi:hypothetical protein